MEIRKFSRTAYGGTETLWKILLFTVLLILCLEKKKKPMPENT